MDDSYIFCNYEGISPQSFRYRPYRSNEDVEIEMWIGCSFVLHILSVVAQLRRGDTMCGECTGRSCFKCAKQNEVVR
jgi:hypothetical protein